ncbi:hypothetical protein JXA88_00350 [Candidatus Fermentibacteria bacterium]|nr:hypothetical protein [Candidatus Fermentibacteria bacterium]
MRSRIMRIVSAALLTGLHCSTSEPSAHCVADPGLDNRLSWEAQHASIAEGTAILKSPDGIEVAQVRQKLETLKPHTNYNLSVRVRALHTPSAQLSLDLFLDEGYDSPDQELLVLPDAIDATFRTFHRTIGTNAFPEQPYLRVFTFSTVPVEVDEIGLVETK